MVLQFNHFFAIGRGVVARRPSCGCFAGGRIFGRGVEPDRGLSGTGEGIEVQGDDRDVVSSDPAISGGGGG